MLKLSYVASLLLLYVSDPAMVYGVANEIENLLQNLRLVPTMVERINIHIESVNF